MRAMQDSGIQWLGEYPATWSLKKIKYCLQERIEKNNPVRTTDILSLTARQGVIPYDQKEGGGNKPKEDVSAYRLAYPGDIVMNSMNILSGSVGLSQYFGCVSPVYYMLRPWDSKEDVRYYNYIFQTTMFQRSLYGLGNGILIKESGNGKLNTIRMRIPMDKFGGLFIPVASADEQRRIADFLDVKCTEIDALIADVQEQIDVLEQYKRSVITETVTRGLNPDAEMKDSGIQWIGMMPSNWDCIRGKYILKYIQMLIERDYRGAKATLAYNGMTFSVPKNLYIIGMMNTADRSLAMIDYALRRRFSFFDIEPGFDSAGFMKYQQALDNETFSLLVSKVQELNKEIALDKSLGKGFCIGHSYFCGQTECTDEWMQAIVDYDILPMLSEYWFDDMNKLQRWENILRGVFQ